MTIQSFYLDILYTDHRIHMANTLDQKVLVFDLVRGLAVFFMVLVHVLGIYSNVQTQQSPFGYVVDFLGSPPAAPVFMVSMGVFYILSTKRNTLKESIIRGLQLYALGGLLSFLRYDLLQLILGEMTLKSAWANKTLTCVWEVDILQFAGLAYIFMGLIRHIFKRPVWWLIIGFALVFTSPLLWGLSDSNPVIQWLLHLLWGLEEDVYFPIFPWLYYPLMGMIFGVCLKYYKDMDKLIGPMLKTSALIIILGSAISLTNMAFHVGDYFHSGPGSVIWITGFLGLWIGGFHIYLTNRVKPLPIRLIASWGRETPSIYFIHWIIIMWATVFLGYEQFGRISTLLIAIVILSVSHQISLIYRKIR